MDVWRECEQENDPLNLPAIDICFSYVPFNLLFMSLTRKREKVQKGIFYWNLNKHSLSETSGVVLVAFC
jgi:hypothetical protein